MSEHLIDELRQHKSEVISTLKKGAAGQPLDVGEYPDIVPGAEPYPHNFVGENVSFLVAGAVENCLATKGAKFAQGKILSQRFLGFTRLGQIPEYEVQIKGFDGQEYTRLLVEHYVSIIR